MPFDGGGYVNIRPKKTYGAQGIMPRCDGVRYAGDLKNLLSEAICPDRKKILHARE